MKLPNLSSKADKLGLKFPGGTQILLMNAEELLLKKYHTEIETCRFMLERMFNNVHADDVESALGYWKSYIYAVRDVELLRLTLESLFGKSIPKYYELDALVA